MKNVKQQKRSQGFTLIELMVVVSIIGILSSVAIPAFVKYIKQTKTAEVYLQLKGVGDSAAQYYQVDHYDTDGVPRPEKMFPSATGEVTSVAEVVVPADVPDGNKHLTTFADWSVTPWIDMKFKISKAQYFQYGYQSNNIGAVRSFVSVARGDLDGDEITSRYELNGQGDDESVTLSPVIPDVLRPLE